MYIITTYDLDVLGRIKTQSGLVSLPVYRPLMRYRINYYEIG
jgi:hypothetical protein